MELQKVGLSQGHLNKANNIYNSGKEIYGPKINI